MTRSRETKQREEILLCDVQEPETRLEIEMNKFLASQNRISTHLISFGNPRGGKLNRNSPKRVSILTHTMEDVTQDRHEPNVEENYH